MKIKRLTAIIILVILLFFLAVSSPGTTGVSAEIVLIPLDSRPCNTDYVLYAAGALDKKLFIPSNFLDNYNHPSSPDNLYNFLYSSLNYADTYIIYTNQIINGGLIASRDPQSYINLESKLSRFSEFLKIAKDSDKKVIVLSVVPRVIPSQFTDLWNFRNELIDFSTNYGKMNLELSDSFPSMPPKEIVSRYLSIYSGSDIIIENMKSRVEEGLIDLLIIGQDDTYKDSITNHQILKYLGYENENIIVQPGADELTKLVLAKMAREETPGALDINIIFTDPGDAKEIRAFEAFSTEKRSAQILDFLNITQNPQSENLAVVHNTPNESSGTLNLIYNNINKNYLGLIDIAYINRGDPALFEDLSYIKNLQGYSGWNTVGNSFGSEYANVVIYNFVNSKLQDFSPEKQKAILENYYKLLYVHFADDYMYQGILRNQLNTQLVKQNDNVSFINDKSSADSYLQKLFTEHSTGLNQALSGTHNNFDSLINITFDIPEVELPWKRTFEARIIPSITVN